MMAEPYPKQTRRSLPASSRAVPLASTPPSACSAARLPNRPQPGRTCQGLTDGLGWPSACPKAGHISIREAGYRRYLDLVCGSSPQC